MKFIILGLTLALALSQTVSITEEKTIDTDKSDFGCKLAMTFDGPSLTAATDTHFKIEWSETGGLWEEGSEYNACFVAAAYTGTDISLVAEPVTQCFRSEYNGEKWSDLEEISTKDFKLTCTNANPVSGDLSGYSCTLFFDKDSNLGIAEDTKYIWFDVDAETSVSTTGISEITPTTDYFFTTDQVEKMTFGAKTCGMASVYSALTGLISIAALAFF